MSSNAIDGASIGERSHQPWRLDSQPIMRFLEMAGSLTVMQNVIAKVNRAFFVALQSDRH
jgi:hypothetical protein